MSYSRGRLIGLSFCTFIILLLGAFGGYSAHAVESCDHIYVAVESYSATCTSEGGTVYQCTECAATYIDDIVDKLDHEWEILSKTSPTCTTSGSLSRRCTVCQTEENTANGDATGHDFSRDSVKKPTCSALGYTYRICEDCGEVEIDPNSYTEKTDHTYDYSITAEPTCLEEGVAEYTCTVCKYNYREPIEKVDHERTAVVTPPTHTAEGYTVYTCEYCGETSIDDITPLLAYDMHYTVQEATCTENGQKFGVCRDGCNYTETVFLPATGHSFAASAEDGWTVVREATETLDGLEQRICTFCGETESRIIAYVAPPPEPVQTYNPAIIICFAFALVLLLAVTIVVLLILIDRAGRKNKRKYATLFAVDKEISRLEHQQ